MNGVFKNFKLRFEGVFLRVRLEKGVEGEDVGEISTIAEADFEGIILL